MDRTECPRCGRHLDKYDLVRCPACLNIFTEYERGQWELLQQQKEVLVNEIIERVQSRLHQLQQGKNDLITETTKHARHLMRKDLIAGVLLILTVSGVGLWQAYNSVTNFVSDQIAIRFAEPHVRETFYEVARTRASQILEEEVRPAIGKVEQYTNQTLRSFESLLREARGRADAANQEIQFFVLVQRALNDDRSAFDELVTIADNSTHSFHGLVLQAIPIIVANLIPNGVFHPQDPQKSETDLAEIELTDFQDAYRNTARIYRVSLLVALWINKKIVERDKLDFSVAVIRDDDSLRAVEAARQIIEEKAKINTDVRDAAKYIEWWERNRERY